jgi:hypothetical protein
LQKSLAYYACTTLVVENCEVVGLAPEMVTLMYAEPPLHLAQFYKSQILAALLPPTSPPLPRHSGPKFGMVGKIEKRDLCRLGESKKELFNGIF